MKLLSTLALVGAALAAPGAISIEKMTVAVTATPTASTTFLNTVGSGATSTVVKFLPGNPSVSSSSSGAAENEKKRATSSSYAIPTIVTVTKTYYPCATPFPSLTPTLPYGDASLPNNFTTENTLYNIESTAQGASAEACCNACFFELPNCVQAYWYSYEGCVVSQATNASVAEFASSQQISSVCPAGIFDGLSYTNDTNPAFQSTGNIAGPCGQTYTNI